MLLVYNIACENRTDFAINFSVRWQDDDGGWHVTEWNSGDYPPHQMRTSPDLIAIGVPADASAITPLVRAPLVHALPGTERAGNMIVSYDAVGGITAKYNVQGPASSFTVVFEG